MRGVSEGKKLQSRRSRVEIKILRDTLLISLIAIKDRMIVEGLIKKPERKRTLSGSPNLIGKVIDPEYY